jgi:hypothetical protein
MKKLVGFFILLFCSTVANAQFSGGNGTENEPYLITTAGSVLFTMEPLKILALRMRISIEVIPLWVLLKINTLTIKAFTNHTVGVKCR